MAIMTSWGSIEFDAAVDGSCEFAGNRFCGSLDEATREMLCAHCRIRHFAAGRQLDQDKWGDSFVVMLDGLSVIREADAHDASRIVTSGMASAGDLVRAGRLVSLSHSDGEEYFTVCISDCTLGVIDGKCAAGLYNANIQFAKTVLLSCLELCGNHSITMLREVGCKDAYAAVRYVVGYCHERGLPLPTHEQIALICNRSRPTVTEMLHKITKNEPVLFS